MAYFVKNNDSVDRTWVGTLIPVGEYYEIQDVEHSRWNTNNEFFAAVSEGTAIIAKTNDGTTDYTIPIEGWNYLTGNIIKEVRIHDLEYKDSLGIPTVTVARPTGPAWSISTHNFSDKCSWFQESVRVESETLTTPDSLTFNSSHDYWIDMTHGRFYGEDDLGGAYDPVIYVDGVEQTTGFSINYEAGTVTFENTTTGVVTADYHYATTSGFTTKPNVGKVLAIQHTEVQFSVDVTFPSPVCFEILAYDVNDLPNKTVVRRIKYKNEKDLLNTSNRGFTVPAFGSLTKDVLILPYDYVRQISLSDAYGMELRIYIENNQPFTCELGTVTLYVYEENLT